MSALVWIFGLCLAISQGPEGAESDLGSTMHWHPPAVAEVRERFGSWLERQTVDAAQRGAAAARLGELSDQPDASELLAALVESAALVDPAAAELLEFCRHDRVAAPLPNLDWLDESRWDPIVRHNLRLSYGIWLCQHQCYDETLQQVGQLLPEDVVDPAALLFIQAAAHYRLLHQEAALNALANLLQQEAALPRRYQSLARLMQADIGKLEEESLEHIARRMGDVQRRLTLQRPDRPTQDVEEGVMKSLDKLIDQLEKQRQQRQASSMPDGQTPFDPSKSPEVPDVKGPGNVAPKGIGQTGGWGNLPPKQRQEALQQVGREFPPHYREIIEQYFRRQATTEEKE